MSRFEIKNDYFGILQKYIEDEDITEITWNGRHLWVDDVKRGRYRTDDELGELWVKMFAQRISNHVGTAFNYSTPVIEAETDDLRISIYHPEIANDRYSLVIRKTPALRRLSEEKMIREGYADIELILFLKMFVEADCSIVIIGNPSSGKTELAKFLTKYIPNSQRTITIEDNYELRLSTISPELDVVELKVNDDTFDYCEAIRTSLRQRPHNIFLSEVRSREATELLEAASTGCRVITTSHCDNGINFPDRFIMMMGKDGEEKRNNIYSFFDVVIQISMDDSGDGIYRNIEQIVLLDRQNESNMLNVFFENGKFNLEAFRGMHKFERKFRKAKKRIPSELLTETEKNLFRAKVMKGSVL